MKVGAGILVAVVCAIAFAGERDPADLAKQRRPSPHPKRGHSSRVAVPCAASDGFADPPTAEVNDATNGTLAGANAAGTMYFSGTIGSSSDRDMYRFCAAAQDTISVGVDGSANVAHLFDRTGAELPGFGGTWTAGYTGVYYAGIGRDASRKLGDYVCAIAVNCRTGAEQAIDLGVTKIATPDTVTAGGTLTYTVTITNAGPDIAQDAAMQDPLPAGTAFQSITGDGQGGGWSCYLPAVGASGTISCSNSCFPEGASFTFTITVTADPCIGNTTLTNTVTVSSLTADSDAGNDVATATVSVIDPGTCDDGNVCTIGDQCGSVSQSTENFDLVNRPFLPYGWDSFLSTGPPGAVPWRTVTTIFDTEPNAVFAPDASDLRDYALDSPSMRILTPTTKLTFQNRYSLERGFDGGVLEIKIGLGPFQDILVAGGSFESGGYDGTISNYYLSPIAGRPAWTGTSPGFVTTIVDLPEEVVGHLVKFRWRLATDQSLGVYGQWIDSVSFTDASSCQPGTSIDCDDGDPCTADTCDPVLGCQHKPASCDDGNACTRTDLCQAGACVGSDPVVCTADDPCHDAGVCDPATGACSSVPKADGSACDDGDACTTNDACTDGTCNGGPALACDDDNPCTDDSCSPATGCVFTNNAIACSDGNSCTTGDACEAGTCKGGPALICNDDNLCTDDSCSPATGCVFTNNAIACSDGNACTTGDACGAGRCNGGPALICTDDNPCTDDSCSPATGCVFTNNSIACNDGNACTAQDVCNAGSCVGSTPVVCTAVDSCHSAGVCDPATGVCSNPVKPDGTTCDDGNACTTGETCSLGTCTPAFGGLAEADPRTNGYYKRLCHGPHSGDRLTDADAVCVGGLTATFAGLSRVAQICDVILPSHPNGEVCDRTEDDLMVLALNICRARVCTASGIRSQCGGNTTVGQSLAESDAIMSDPARDAGTCSHAKCLDEEINTGRALE